MVPEPRSRHRSAPATSTLAYWVVYASQEPVFANSDLQLLRLLADQAAVVLEGRTLLDEVVHVHAREEAMRLKVDFLSSAAHQLKTPLTGYLPRPSTYCAGHVARRTPRPTVAPRTADARDAWTQAGVG